MTTKLDNLFDRILSETDTDNAAAAERAALYAAITHPQTSTAPNGDATERLAAHLDGALESDDAARFAASLADAPDEVYELEAAQAFVDAIDANREMAPADLVAAAAADLARPAPHRAVRRSWFLNSASWGRQFAWAGGAAATVLLGVIIVDRANEIVRDPTVAAVPVTPVETGLRPVAQQPLPQLPLPTPPAVPSRGVDVAPLPPPVEARPQGLFVPPPRVDTQPRDQRNERETREEALQKQMVDKIQELFDGERARNAAQPQAPSTLPSQNQTTVAPPPPVTTSPAPQAEPAAKTEEIPETVLITGSLIRGTAAVGVPVTNLSPQDFAQTGTLTTSDLFRTFPSASKAPPAPAARAGQLAQGLDANSRIRIVPPGTQSQAAESRYAAAPPPALAAPAAPAYAPNAYPQNTERYPGARPNAVKLTSQEPVSTFSLDVDTASYANVRRFLTQGTLPPVDAVRVEEMVNYFDYAYMLPRDRDVPFQPSVVVYPSPWNPDTQILHVGIKGYDIPRSERPKSNLVFLIDTSGSMASADKLPLVKRSFQLLVEQLKADDHVSIVVYAGSAGMVLPPTPGWDKDTILASLDRLQSGGSTAGGEGIRQAYELAKANFDRRGVNRVILATDGDFNVGITDPNALEAFVARERSSGVFLSVLGYGGGNYNDLLMQKLAQAGNGTAAYIDTLNEARKVLVDEMSSTLFTIAKDVKVQIEFNPERVAEYRLIGYETRMLNQTDFNNDKVDAGDVGSGHTVTALYEITPVGSRAQTTDPLRYGKRAEPRDAQSELAFVKIRYKLPTEDVSKLITRPVENRDVVSDFNRLPIDYRFAAVVAGSAQLLRHDPYIKSFDYGRAIEIAQAARGDDEFGYRNEFVQLLRQAQSAASLQDLGRSLPRSRD
jgi:Ca-activated chloride channel homolog